ncbi:hypothetical protein HOI18_01250 [Candidatus Uhrbacteria bacterium]|nr:hypothetical protein [Candidatus Uhrbacteria bacterium]
MKPTQANLDALAARMQTCRIIACGLDSKICPVTTSNRAAAQIEWARLSGENFWMLSKAVKDLEKALDVQPLKKNPPPENTGDTVIRSAKISILIVVLSSLFMGLFMAIIFTIKM